MMHDQKTFCPAFGSGGCGCIAAAPVLNELPQDLIRAALLGLDPRANLQDVALAEARCRRALALVDTDSSDAAAAHSILGGLLESEGRFVEAQNELEMALAVRERVFGPDDPLVAETLDKLGLVYRQRGFLERAEALYRRAIGILSSRPAAVELGAALNNLGNLLAARGRVAEGEVSLRQAIEVWEKLLGPEHPNIAAALSNLSSLERTRHRYAEAERLLAQALEMDRKLLPANSVRIGLDLNNAGSLMAARKHYADAEAALRDSLTILRGGLPAGHPGNRASVGEPRRSAADGTEDQGSG